MISEFGKVDKDKATLRIFTTIYESRSPLTRLDLISQLEEDDVGRSAFYTSFKTLKELDLVTSFDMKLDGKRHIMTTLTDKGAEIAKKLVEIKNILERNEK